MKLFGTILAAGLLAASTAGATACLSTQTLAALDTTGCTETFTNFTLTFSNFTSVYSGPDSASNITANLDFTNVIGLGGFTFEDTSGAFLTGSATSIGYTVAISGCTVGDTCNLTGYSDQVFIPTNNPANVTISYNPVPSPGGTPQTASFGDQTIIQPGSIDATTAVKLGVYNGSGTLISYESDVFATATAEGPVPEPGTVSLLGAGLLGLGLLGRRRRVRK